MPGRDRHLADRSPEGVGGVGQQIHHHLANLGGIDLDHRQTVE